MRLAKLAILALIVSSCKTLPKDQDSDIKFVVLSNAPACAKGLKRLFQPTYRICINAQPGVSPERISQIKKDFEDSLNVWTQGLAAEDFPARKMSIAFANCPETETQPAAPSQQQFCKSAFPTRAFDEVDLWVNVIGNQEGCRSNAQCGHINLEADASASTVLHELGHSFVSLGDTYLENDQRNCIPGQPRSVMCNHSAVTIDGLKLTPDDVAGLKTVFDGLHREAFSPVKVVERARKLLPAFAGSVTGCKLSIEDPVDSGFASLIRTYLVATSTADPSRKYRGQLDLTPSLSDAALLDRLHVDHNDLPGLAKADCRSTSPLAKTVADAVALANASLSTCQLAAPSVVSLPSWDFGESVAYVDVRRKSNGQRLTTFEVSVLPTEDAAGLADRLLFEYDAQWLGANCGRTKSQPTAKLAALKIGDSIEIDFSKRAVWTFPLVQDDGTMQTYKLVPDDKDAALYLFDKKRLLNVSRRGDDPNNRDTTLLDLGYGSITRLKGPRDGLLAIHKGKQDRVKLVVERYVDPPIPIPDGFGTKVVLDAEALRKTLQPLGRAIFQFDVDAAGDYALLMRGPRTPRALSLLGPNDRRLEIDDFKVVEHEGGASIDMTLPGAGRYMIVVEVGLLADAQQNRTLEYEITLRKK